MDWDFRSTEEKDICDKFRNKGYIINKGGKKEIDQIREIIQEATREGLRNLNIKSEMKELEEVHMIMDGRRSNELRLQIMSAVNRNNNLNLLYYRGCQKIINSLCGSELAMQRRIGLSINFPQNNGDVLPIHADTWNGVSPYELNILIPLVDCRKTMGLYILEKNDYLDAINEKRGLMNKSSSEMYEVLKDKLKWIDIDYGEILAFDQSLPHGYCLNNEANTQWSLNCRFKGLNTPYWDKKLGEYFMPITVKTCTRVGLEYNEPKAWITNNE